MPKPGFTVLSVKALPDGTHADGATKGLYLRVRGNSRLWTFRYTRDTKAHTLGLGSVADVTLKEARDKAIELRAKLAKGIDPAAAAETPIKPTSTFAQDTNAYFEHHHREWSKEHAGIWLNSVKTHVWATLGDRDTASLTVPDIVSVLQPLWLTKNETAVRLHGRIRNIIEHAADTDDHGRFDGGNPADRALRRLPKGVRPKEQPRRSLPYAELPALYRRLQALPLMQARCLQWLLLCCTPRSGEVTGATWGEIVLGDGPFDNVFRVPANRMKSRVARDVPQSRPALDLLASIRPANAKPDDFIFPGRIGRWEDDQLVPFSGHIADGAMQVLLREMGVAADVHGLRASFRTWATDNAQTVQDHDAAETALDHRIGGKVARAYDRADLIMQRRDLAERWATFLMGR